MKITEEIKKYKESDEFERLKNTLIAKGEIKTLDLFFNSLTLEQKTNIINDETLDLGKYNLSDWWKGMTKTEKTEALLSLIKLNLNL